MSNAKFVVVDGIDATGKTSLVDSFSKRHGWAKVKALPTCYKEVVQESARLMNHNSYHLTVLAALKYTSDQIVELLDSGVNVISDRYVWTPYFYHRAIAKAWGLDNVIYPEFEPFNFVNPDLTVVLTVDEEVRQKRLILRGNLQGADSDLQNEITRQEIENGFLSKADFILDTTGPDLFQCVELLRDRVDLLKK